MQCLKAGTLPVEVAYTVEVICSLIVALMSKTETDCLTVPAADFSVDLESLVSAAIFAVAGSLFF